MSENEIQTFKIDLYKKRDVQYVIEGDCWITVSHRSIKYDYPIIKIDSKTVRLYDYIYTKHFGEIPEGAIVTHTCKNKYCINPEHLKLKFKYDFVIHICKNKECLKSFNAPDYTNIQDAPAKWRYCDECVSKGFKNKRIPKI